ncbi:MAG: ATP-binding protein [Elusimicrobia bacterium]|nr:ATP-binding protein [Elusimicrobiota bacterium]
MITRAIQSALTKSKKSILLLGPRQTGKSTLVSSLNPEIVINLAHEATYLDFVRNPHELEQRLRVYKKPTSVFIDEIQRIPSLLNTIQFLLDKPENPFHFFLTGSSARKLKRGHANLLPGRIHSFYLGPITCGELDYKMDTAKALSRGSLPGIWTEEDASSAEKTLRTYAATYLKEEIQAESLARNLEGFARFLHVTAEWAGHFLDLSKMAAAAQIARQSAVRYFEVLEDCLIIHHTNPFSKSLTRRLVQHPRFYFFDVGVLNGLLGNFNTSADRIGSLFEHLICTQIYHGANSRDKEIRLSSFRTEHGAEVDLIVAIERDLFAIELKASKNIGTTDLRGLKSFSDYYGKKHHAFVFFLGDHKKQLEGVDILPWQEGIKTLGL